MELPELIEVNPDVMSGQPCLKGTRIPVGLIVEKLRAGETPEEILAAYPQLSPDHIKAAEQYAAQPKPIKDLPSKPGEVIGGTRRADFYDES